MEINYPYPPCKIGQLTCNLDLIGSELNTDSSFHDNVIKMKLSTSEGKLIRVNDKNCKWHFAITPDKIERVRSDLKTAKQILVDIAISKKQGAKLIISCGIDDIIEQLVVVPTFPMAPPENEQSSLSLNTMKSFGKNKVKGNENSTALSSYPTPQANETTDGACTSSALVALSTVAKNDKETAGGESNTSMALIPGPSVANGICDSTMSIAQRFQLDAMVNTKRDGLTQFPRIDSASVPLLESQHPPLALENGPGDIVNTTSALDVHSPDDRDEEKDDEDVIAQDAADEETDGSLLLLHNPTQAVFPASNVIDQHGGWRLRYPPNMYQKFPKWVSLLLLVLAVSLMPLVYEKGYLDHRNGQSDCGNNRKNHGKDTQVDRISRIVACSYYLSNGIGFKYNENEESDDGTYSYDTSLNHGKISPQLTAVTWFVSGAGRYIDVPETKITSNNDNDNMIEEVDDNYCSWDSSFGMVYSLIVLRESLNIQDKSWYPIKPLKTFHEICSWTRITCDINNQNVERLILTQANLDGTIPSELAGLSYSLSDLLIYSNSNITGTIPTELGLLTNLKRLDLQTTSLSGTIPTTLGYLTNLKELLLDHTLLKGQMPTEICNLRNENLIYLHASCHGDNPSIECDQPSCCTSC